MNRLRLRVSRNGQSSTEGDADEYTVVLEDSVTGDAVIAMWGDGQDGAWIYEPSEDEPWHLTPTGAA